MKNSFTVTIGIPAFNEEENISSVIRDVLRQKCRGFTIVEVIVSSDGSTDKTVDVVRRIKNKKVRVMANKDRKGISRGLNQIIKTANSDVLVTLDADIKIYDTAFIEKLIKPILEGDVDLTSSAIKEVVPSTFFDKTLYVSMLLKNVLFANLKDGNNIYTCHGLARGYSKRFYSKLRIPVSVGNDMYTYLACVSKGYNYQYAKKAGVLYRLPQTYADHKKQSLRFFDAAKQQANYFGADFVHAQTAIPSKAYFQALLMAVPVLAKYPIHSFAYFWLQLYLKFKSSLGGPQKQTWEMVNSSKKL